MKEMASLEEAHALIDELREGYYFRREIESVETDDALGRELAEPIISEKRSPERDIATMDGYAINCHDEYPLKIVGDIHAGEKGISRLKRGSAVWIATGASLPDGANAVLRVEDAKVKDGMLYGPKIEEGNYIIRAGTDYEKGEEILDARTRIAPHTIAVLHSLGISKVKVFKKARVGVYSTGDEIFKGMIQDTNGPMLMAFLKEWGSEGRYLGAIPDDLEATKEMILDATKYDAVVTSGGVSVGRRDYVIKAIEELGEVLLHGVMTRPGKPMVIGVLRDTPVFGLPGKPTGSFMAAELNLRRYFLGYRPRAKRLCECVEDVNLPKEKETLGSKYITFAHIRDGKAYPLGYKGSSMEIFSPKSRYGVSILASSQRAIVADGYIMTDKGIKRGDIVEVNLF
ncbi:MAG: molybdopterin molybdotransferase MoeA [Candidatus Hydrothermarchaeales archaeon]